MAFHVACPITCRRICDCELGFPAVLRGARGRGEFLEEVARVEEFLRDPWTVKAAGGGAVQVLVPRVVPPPPAQPPAAAAAEDGADREELPSSALARRAALQRKALAESMAAEDYIRRMEAGGAAEVPGEETANVAGEDQSSLTAKVMCRICFSGENEGSDRAIKMLSCKLCSKKYHRSCLKIWAEYRDLFHWSSWTCPACRICEVCRRTGDPSKLMYCKRCDGAYHCYCQQPPHKNVSHGPFLCPKHTRCHSCGSAVPGNGHSTRWFLGYTCCDACGRLFVKGNFCPVCLKVYRDSEPTPMVCCDVCQQWVHCECDGISDEKYQQFQADGNLYYKCAACRGDCYQVKDIDDAVRELWKRRDKADRGQIASLRAAAGLPLQEELFSIFPFSDDEESCPVVLKNDHGKSLKFSVKGLIDKSSNTTKEYGKNISKNLSSNKKYPEKGYQIHLVCKSQEPHQSVDTQHEARSLESGFRDQRIGGMESYKSDGLVSFSCPLNSVPDDDKAKFQIEQRGGNNHSVTKEHVTNSIHKVSKVKIKGSKSQGLQLKDDAGKNASKSGTMKGTKLVIHIGAKSRNSTSSPRSEASSCHKEQDLAASNGCEDTSQLKAKDNDNYILDELGENVRNDGPKGVKLDNATKYATNMRNSKHGDRGSSLIKLGKVSDIQRRSRANIDEGCELMSETRNPLIMSKRRTDESPGVEASADAAPWINEAPPRKQSLEKPINLQSKVRDAAELLPRNSTDDPKPLLKLKFKNPYFEQRSSWAAWGVEEKNSVKGQRSKRKRPASMEKVGTREDGSCTHVPQENPIDEAIDANWILQKLGKDAIGKRVEVHQSSDNSWHRGVVSDIMEGTSSLSVRLDDGRSRTLELGKQGVRFISQKQKRTK